MKQSPKCGIDHGTGSNSRQAYHGIFLLLNWLCIPSPGAKRHDCQCSLRKGTPVKRNLNNTKKGNSYVLEGLYE